MVSVSRRPGVEEAASPDLVCVVGRAASMEDTSNVAAWAGRGTSLDYTKGARRETGAKEGLSGGKASGYFFSGRLRIECTALRLLIFEGKSPWIAGHAGNF